MDVVQVHNRADGAFINLTPISPILGTLREVARKVRAAAVALLGFGGARSVAPDWPV